MTGLPAFVTMAGAYPTGCYVWKALNTIALFRRTVLVNNNKSMNIYSLALGSHIPSSSEWISYPRDPTFLYFKNLKPDNYTL